MIPKLKKVWVICSGVGPGTDYNWPVVEAVYSDEAAALAHISSVGKIAQSKSAGLTKLETYLCSSFDEYKVAKALSKLSKEEQILLGLQERDNYDDVR